MVGHKQFDLSEALDAATRAFWKRGYSATGISDLVEATGLSRGSIYGTFGDKQSFFLACLERYVHIIGAPTREALTRQDDAVRTKVRAGFDAILTRLADPETPPGCLLAQTLAESGALDESLRAAVQGTLQDQIAQMRKVLSEGPGGAAAEEMDALATYLVSVAQAIAIMHRAGIPVDELTPTCDQALRVLDHHLV